MSAIEWEDNKMRFSPPGSRNGTGKATARSSILCGVDLNTAMTQDEDSKAHLCRRLKRLI
jgi:hypothetical protein